MYGGRLFICQVCLFALALLGLVWEENLWGGWPGQLGTQHRKVRLNCTHLPANKPPTQPSVPVYNGPPAQTLPIP